MTASARMGSRESSLGRSWMLVALEARSHRTNCSGYDDARYLQILSKLKGSSGLRSGLARFSMKSEV